MLKNLNLVSADHNLNILLQLDVGSLSIIVNGEELEVEDADDGGADRHGASAQTDWKDFKMLNILLKTRRRENEVKTKTRQPIFVCSKDVSTVYQS